MKRRFPTMVVLAALAAAASCAPREERVEHVEKPSPAEAHGHAAPHGGALVVLGDELAHVELVLDPATGGLVAYILDGSAERGIPLAAESLGVDVTIGGNRQNVVLRGVANPLTGEHEGETSEFHGACEALRGVERFEGRLVRVDVKGSAFEEVPFRFPEGNE